MSCAIRFSTRWTVLSLFLLFLVQSPSLFSQVKKNEVRELTEGTEYFFTVPHCAKEPGEGARGAASVELWVSSKRNATVFVATKAHGSFQAKVNANKVTKIPLNDSYMNTKNEIIQNLGIHLTSTEAVSVTVYVSYRWSGETYRVIPAVWLGKRYRTLNLYQDETDEIKPSQIVICATQDNTTVKYTPSFNTENIKKGKTGTIVLDKGQTFLIHNEKRSAYTHVGGDLTGSYIEADKPIAVLSGHTKGAFPRYSQRMLGRPANFMRNMLIEMMWPEELLGTEYISAPILYTNRYVRNIDPDDIGDMIRFVAVVDGTIISQMRQDGTGLKPISKSLRKGEFHEITNMEMPAMYRSNFPVLVGHYGKAWRNQFITSGIDKGEGGQNPSRNGCGMMIVLVPKERWCSYAVFHSPSGLDNFMYVTFNSEDESKLKFDDVPFRSKFGGGIKQISGTPYSYVAAQIAFGDHTIEGAPFAAYAYGNWDYSKDGFAYGYPTGFNLATKCPDSVTLVGAGPCGNIKGEARALPEKVECAKLFTIEMIADSSSNYTFKSSSDFGPQGNYGTFELTVTDNRKPARALVRAVSMSGKFVEEWYTYEPEMLTFTPKSINFGELGIDVEKCEEITLTNDGKTPTTVNKLSLKFGLAEFKFKDLVVPFTLLPGESKIVTVCGTAKSKGIEFDSVLAELTCYPEALTELKISAFIPQVVVEDINFGKVPKNAVVKKPAQIINSTSKSVTVTGLNQWKDTKHFLKVEGLTFPFELKSGQTKTFIVDYTPAGEVGVLHIDTAWFTANTNEIKLWSEWRGEGTNAELFITSFDWQEKRVLDNFVTGQEKIDGYEATIQYGNTGNVDITDAKLTVVGADGQYFTVPTASVPSRLVKGETYPPLRVFFKPEWVEGTRTGERPYAVKLVLSGKDNTEDRVVEGDLMGIGVQPHIAMTPQIDFGTLEVNTKSNDKSTVNSNGSMKLTLTGTINDLRIEGVDKDYFTIDPEFLKTVSFPHSVAVGDIFEVPLIFAPTIAGKVYNAVLRVNHDAPETVQTDLLGSAKFTSTLVKSGQIQGAVLPPHFICSDPQGTVVFTNTSPDNVIARFKTNPQLQGTDAQYFSLLPIQLLDKAPTQSLNIPFQLLATEARAYNAEVVLDVEWFDPTTNNIIGTEQFVAAISGTGKTVSSTVLVGATQKVEVGTKYEGEKAISVELSDANLNEVGIITFKVFVGFDPNFIYPYVGKHEIITAGTLTEGWSVVNSGISAGKDNEFFIEFRSTSEKPLKVEGNKTLFKFTGLALLNNNLTSDITINDFALIEQLNPEIQGNSGKCVTVNEVPGKVELIPGCAANLRVIHSTGAAFQDNGVSPSPSTSESVMRFSIGLEMNTTVAVYNSMGKLVATLVNEKLKPGEYEASFNVDSWGSGVYQYKITNGPFSTVNSFVVQH